ncbi:MAG: phytoene desaturase [Bacteroidetes bacterium]|nr:MAG: phytoene desaturase [Bacteroidota bacterium]
MKKTIHIIGSGVAGLSAASFLAKAGHEVTVFEKNDQIGGRARLLERDAYRFDMGPSWYWMPEVFERFYEQFGHRTEDFYELKRLDPAYRIFWEDGSQTDLPASEEALYDCFEEFEPGSAVKLKKFLKEAAYKYEVGMTDLVFKPGLSWTEFVDSRVMKGLASMHLTTSFSKYIRKYFKHPKILSILEFPVLFLGAMPSETPALYSLMNFADLKLGTWYPMGGMHRMVQAFEQIAQEQGVRLVKNAEVSSFEVVDKNIASMKVGGVAHACDYVVSGADYHHTDRFLAAKYANYSETYWEKRQMAPSCLLFYVGVNKKVDGLKHHNLFFDAPFDQHAEEIYKNPSWPANPLFYVCCPSKTDPSVAPENCENLFLLIPLAPGMKDDPSRYEEYFELMIGRIEEKTGSSFRSEIQFHQSYCLEDFKRDYHAFKGNAYGLANTLRQTAIWKPKIKNKHLNNLYYTGQLTVPGPGLPPSIISGEVVAKELLRSISK